MPVSFTETVIAWQRAHGRHDLPWQNTRDPYRIWLSEIMLQQTQVTTVIPYYRRFTERFPRLEALAAAHEDDVLALWSGLGYYSRARNLHRAAMLIMERFNGRFPASEADLLSLPGVGRSTAAAIGAFAFGRRSAILDGNVKRVLARYFGIHGYPGEAKNERIFWNLAESLLPEEGIEAYTQGLMDLGATLCLPRRPLCDRCPCASGCAARNQGTVGILPTPKPRKALPERAVVMSILLRNDHVYLEKRPSRGVWGGLWSLPEQAEPQLLGQTGPAILQRQALPQLIHVFTHFRLTVSPVLIRLDEGGCLPEMPGRWVSVLEVSTYPLPSPVRRILHDALSPAATP